MQLLVHGVACSMLPCVTRSVVSWRNSRAVLSRAVTKHGLKSMVCAQLMLHVLLSKVTLYMGAVALGVQSDAMNVFAMWMA
jgi:hypothetical protein